MKPETIHARKTYTGKYKNKPKSYWQDGVYTDEHHLNTGMRRKQHIYREMGTRNEPENRQMQPYEGKAKKDYQPFPLHIGAGVSYEGRTDIKFFHDEHYDLVDPWNQWLKRKPYRNRKNYKELHAQWEAEKPFNYEILPKSTVMTQEYYLNSFLPMYGVNRRKELVQEPLTSYFPTGKNFRSFDRGTSATENTDFHRKGTSHLLLRGGPAPLTTVDIPDTI
jgi:hypothetical protein